MKFRIHPVTSSESPEFARATRALATEFAPRGELEPRSVLSRWVDEAKPMRSGRWERSYVLLHAETERGELAGVRDCHILLDTQSRLAVAYLAHVLVLPPFRRTGLGARLREEPIALARAALAGAGIDPLAADLLLAAEMEPIEPNDPATQVRLVAYGKHGFRVISPEFLAYFQPDFRELRSEQELLGARPLPLLAVVRWVGRESSTVLPTPLVRAFLEALYAVFATHVHPTLLRALERRTLEPLERSGCAEVPLLQLPRSTNDSARMEPLLRQEVLIHYDQVLQ